MHTAVPVLFQHYRFSKRHEMLQKKKKTQMSTRLPLSLLSFPQAVCKIRLINFKLLLWVLSGGILFQELFHS